MENITRLHVEFIRDGEYKVIYFYNKRIKSVYLQKQGTVWRFVIDENEKNDPLLIESIGKLRNHELILRVIEEEWVTEHIEIRKNGNSKDNNEFKFI